MTTDREALFARMQAEIDEYDTLPLPMKSYLYPTPSAADLRALLALARTSPKATEWRPIASAPRDGTIFLAVNMRGGSPGMNRYELCFSDAAPEGKTWAVGAGWRNPGRDWPAHPTHWQPIPQPPEQANG